MREFFGAVGVDAIMLTKCDSLARSGFIFSIGQELNIPVSFLGVGEALDQIKLFNREDLTDLFLE